MTELPVPLEPRGFPPTVRAVITAVVMSAITYGAVWACTQYLVIGHFVNPLWWPVAGINLVVLIRFPLRQWWILLIGFAVGIAAASPLAQNWTTMLAFVAVNVVEVVVTALMLIGATRAIRSRANRPAQRARRLADMAANVPVDALRFAIAATCGIAAGSGVFLASRLAFPSDAPIGHVIAGYAVTHLVGIFTLAPLLLPGRLGVRLPGRLAVELGINAILLVITADIIFLSDDRGMARAFLVLVPAIWAGLRFGPVWATATTAVTAFAASYGTAHDRGTFAVLSSAEARLWIVQLYIAVAAVIVLALVLITRHREQLAERLRDSEATLRIAMRDAQVGMYTLRMDEGHLGEITSVNPAVCALLGYEPGDLVGEHIRILFFGPGSSRSTDPERIDAFDAHLHDLASDAKAGFRSETSLYRSDGTRLWAEVAVTRVQPSLQPVYVLVHVHDLTDRKRKQDDLEQMALTDPLTGLANRALLFRELTIAIASRRPARPLALLYLDVDQFKQVNDAHGHAAGDAVLVAVADRLRGQLRPQDVASRLGGDEFAAMLTDVRSASELDSIRIRLQAVLARPIALPGGGSISVSVSVGTALTSEDGDGERSYDGIRNGVRDGADPRFDADALLRQADAAMYRVKHHRYGRSGAGVTPGV